MGRASDEGIRHHHRVSIATDLCVKVRAIIQCELHEEGLTHNLGCGTPEEVTEEILAVDPNAIHSFDSQADMVNCVSSALDEAGLECGYCAYRADHD